MRTTGDRDSNIPASIQAIHDAACAREEGAYVDPQTGGMVMTAYKLTEMDYCCGNGCRHCPWPASVQLAAGRSAARDLS